MEKENKKQTKRENRKPHKGAVIGLTIATSILGATTLGLGVAYGVSMSQSNSYATQLDSIYKRNYYDLVENANIADTKISKLLVAEDEDYIIKMLGELSQTAKEMQMNISALPVSSDNIVMSVRFINQMSGYTQTLEEKIATGGSLTSEDLQTLNDMHESLTEMKKFLNQMSLNMMNGYSILDASQTQDGDFDSFTVQMSQIKSETDYPTMIYDGPFADSVVNKKVIGLTGDEISKEDAYKKIDEIFKNVSNIKYDGQTSGRFDSYNYSLLYSNGQKIFVQVSKLGGHILTVSGNVQSQMKNIDLARAEKIALNFAQENGIENAKVVWHEELNDQAYFNIAPTQNDIILYPDLVKVKVDMDNAEVIGYDAITYWTNHTKRNLSSASITSQQAQSNIGTGFTVKNKRLVLSPLEYNREVLCWELECEKDGATYYYYINATSGATENILKVVETNDSSKLM